MERELWKLEYIKMLEEVVGSLRRLRKEIHVLYGVDITVLEPGFHQSAEQLFDSLQSGFTCAEVSQ